jgi:hypothetical protein
MSFSFQTSFFFFKSNNTRVARTCDIQNLLTS